MADVIPNIALGRTAELYKRVDTNDPANAALVIAILATTGLEADAVLRDKETLAAVVAGATNEVTNANYARKVLTDADIVAFAADHVNDRVDLDFPDQTFTSIASGDGWSKAVLSYDSDSTGGTDTSIEPLGIYDFVHTPNGNDITLQTPNGFFRASQA